MKTFKQLREEAPANCVGTGNIAGTTPNDSLKKSVMFSVMRKKKPKENKKEA